ncbi:hypothetical protein SETIT_8G237700v2 [Setaria italica]|uniref:Uncharacterized protein n=1 Tax=Setaria italica TaxID=4555 RepID=K3ZJ21_SETIT|nr:transcription factor JAMYB [Setaria italica]RCV39608.1 hypothetical protein SETIT_8G237700v2 [Setaria italica]
MEMVLQPQRAAGISGGCRPGPPRPAAAATAATAAMMAMPRAKREHEEMMEAADGAAAEVEAEAELRRGPWTVDEDLTLINYIAEHGEGRWNALARAAGLKRTGKSCRLRWLNYLRPDVKRGDFTADEQLLILDLHSRWGNRWSKIAAQLPGRTDNEIKNYWRTRVQKHAKQLNCDVNSARFKDAMRFLWMPRLAERAAAAQHQHHQQAAAAIVSGGAAVSTTLITVPEVMTMMMNNENDDDRSPCSAVTTATTTSSSSSHTSSESTARDAVPVGGGGDEWAAMQQQDQEFWSTASALQQLTAAGSGDHHQLFQFQADLPLQDLTGWVQGFSDGVSPETTTQLWSLDDIWRMQ